MRHFLWMITLLGVLSAPAGAQTRTGGVSGMAADETGAAMPGVTVTLESPALQVPQMTAVTDAEGRYGFVELPAGVYRVTFALDGFTRLVREQIQLTTGFTARVDVVLRVAALQEMVTVVGGSPLVDIVHTRGGSVLSKDLMETIPISNNYSDILRMTPGMVVTTPPEFGKIGASGTIKAYGMSGQARTMIDGLDMRGSDSPNFDAVEEVASTTFGNTADVMTPGANINLVLKSGGNEFHGGLSEEYMTKNVQATNIDAPLIAQGISAGDGLVRFEDIGGDLGGRVIRDRLWFYTAGRYQTSERTLTGYVRDRGPDGIYGTADDVPSNTHNSYTNVTGKFSYQISPRHKLIGLWARNLRYTPELGAGRYVPYEATLDWHFWLRQRKLEWQGTLTNKLFVTAVAGATGSKSAYIDPEDRRGLSTFDRNTLYQTGEAWSDFNNASLDQHRRQILWTATYLAGSPGIGIQHDLKAGGNLWFLDSPNDVAGRPLTTTDGTPGGTYRTIFDSGVPVQLQTRNFPVVLLGNANSYGAYLNDTWRLTNSLTLNLGVRVDRNVSFVPETTKEPGPFDQFVPAGVYPRIDVGTWSSWAPRLGIAYAVDQSGKTVLKSTYGRYSYLVDEYFARNFSKVNRTVATYTWRDRNGNKKYDFGEVNLDPNGPDFVSITGLASQNPNTFALPHQDEVTASVERELTSTLSVRGLYVFKQSAGEYSIVNVGRPYSSYNVVLTRQDPGPDGTLGNADDGGLVTIWDYDPALRGGSFVRNEVRNRPSNRSDSANNMELAFTKRSQGRWSGSFSFLATKQHRWLVGVPESPNDDVFPLDRTWEISYRTDGQYRLPYGLYASGMFTWMNGQPGQRTYLFRNLPQSSTRTVRLEEYGAQRGPSRTNLNLRVAKTLTLRRQKLDLSIDIFNVFNSNSAWAIGYASGPTFGNTTSIAPPRLASFRAAYKF